MVIVINIDDFIRHDNALCSFELADCHCECIGCAKGREILSDIAAGMLIAQPDVVRAIGLALERTTQTIFDHAMMTGEVIQGVNGQTVYWTE